MLERPLRSPPLPEWRKERGERVWEREEEGRGSGKETLAEREGKKARSELTHGGKGDEDAGAVPPPSPPH